MPLPDPTARLPVRRAGRFAFRAGAGGTRFDSKEKLARASESENNPGEDHGTVARRVESRSGQCGNACLTR
ncbi:hypothetical protein Ga0080559_TMP4411 [Salipiger profundus]|uniref:Uncharacterized protein n=1 Tax=Salipiger profundus TaxID=1229727 RepID=A0A1U7DAK2_9RHOB|nr:hypothetical protein Ga0080559_TMP4411 [Salipiger profundus]